MPWEIALFSFIRYRRHPTIETTIVAVTFIAALLTITFVVTGREDAPPQPNDELPGSWEILASGTTANLADIVFVDSENGWVVGDGGAILHTSDGGNTWVRQDSGVKTKLAKVTFSDLENGWVVGNLGVIVHTSNGGDTWELQRSESTIGLDLIGVQFDDERKGWVMAARGSILLRTIDGGKFWSRESFGNPSNRSDMAFLDFQRGWVVFTGGNLAHTSDAGTSWEYVPGVAPGANIGTNGVFFLDETHGWIAGWRGRTASIQSGLQFNSFLTDGMIALTTDGGISWIRQDSGTGRFLWDVAFVDTQEGWAVGSFGTILYSRDGGVTWELQYSGTEEILQSMVFIDKTLGWAVGEGGVILRYRRQ